MDFIPFKTALARRFEDLSRYTLYRTAVERDVLWDTYLGSFPPGSNPMFRQRTEHDCSCCRNFVKVAGGLVAIVGNELVSIWDVTVNQPAYQVVADAMSRLVKSHPIGNIFLHTERTVGTDVNHEDANGTIRTWDHFFLRLPMRNQGGCVCDRDSIGPSLSRSRSSHDVFLRSLSDISMDSIETVLDLIDQNSIYRGEEHGSTVREFLRLKKESAELDEAGLDLFVWSNVGVVHESVARIRNTVIGSLLTDVNDGIDVDDAVRSFEAKVAPTNYKRPTALVTKAMVSAARAKITELGLASALERRFATLEDVSVKYVIFVDRGSRQTIGMGDVFDDVPVRSSVVRNLDRIEVVSMDRFVSEIVPGLSLMEVMFDNRLTANLVSLIAPVDPASSSLFKWDNRFSWSYNNDVADSIRERVKSAGGDVTGDLCCRLSWFNYDDLDLHMIEPNGYEIYYPNKGRLSPCGGTLDVDMNASVRHTRQPVENIFYRSKASMGEGTYYLFVYQFNRRESIDVGFNAEIDYMGTTYNFVYDKVVSDARKVIVAKFLYSHRSGIEILESLPIGRNSKVVWNLETNKFHRVSAMMLSPNHWGERGTGNRHHFIMLEGCRNDGQARGFYNEFLREDLSPHRKVIEIVGSKVRTEVSDRQLSGLGFSSTQRNEILVKLNGARMLRVTI